MEVEGLHRASESPDFPVTKILQTVQALEDELAAAKHNAKKAESQRNTAQVQLDELKNDISCCRSEMQKAVLQLQVDNQRWTAQVRKARFPLGIRLHTSIVEFIL